MSINGITPKEFERLEYAEGAFDLGQKDTIKVRAILKALHFDQRIIEAYIEERPLFGKN